MSLFDTDVFGDTLGQVALPEPASDALIHDLATTGGSTPSRTVEPGPEGTTPKTDFAKPAGMVSSGMPMWAPYALVGGGVLFVGLLIWSATRTSRPTPNRKRRSRR